MKAVSLWLLACLLSCSCLAASDSYAEQYYNMDGLLSLEQEELQCMSVLSICKAGWQQQTQKCSHHRSLLNMQTGRWNSFVIGFWILLAAGLFVNNVRLARQQQRLARQCYELEKYLRRQLQGVKDQAMDYAEKLQSPRPAAGEAISKQQQAVVQGLHLHHNCTSHDTSKTDDTMSPQPYSVASTPPAPASESSAPNYAVLVAHAPPALDAGMKDLDQLASGIKASPVKSPAGRDKPSPQLPSASPAQQPAFAAQLQPVSANRQSGPGSSPAGGYSPQISPNPVAPPSAGHTPMPGGPVPAGATRPGPGNMPSPPAGYQGPRPPMPGSAQRASPGMPPAQRTPQQQQFQQQQQQAMSCPPMPAAGSPYGPRPMAPGAAPHSAGPLQGAMAGMPAAHAKMPPQGMMAPQGTPRPAAPGGWVNTSRGSGTPPPFGYGSPMGSMQQQPFPSHMMSPLGPGMGTPGTPSTAQTGGSMTRVQSVHSTAGSCGGPAPPSSSNPGTPMSASSTTSGGARSSGASRSPASALNRDVPAAWQKNSRHINEQLDVLLQGVVKGTEEKARLAKEEAAQRRAQMQVQAASPAAASSPADIRQSPV